MAPTTRARRQADITTKAQLSTAADGDPTDPTAPSPDHINDECRRSRDARCDLDEAGDSQDHRLWTPEPEPDADAETYTAWGRKHFGDDWYEQRETMLQERDFYDRGMHKLDDQVYVNRQKALRKMEQERQEGKLPLRKGKTWKEVMAWARMHYGETWWAQLAAPHDREKKSTKKAKRWLRLRNMQLARDEELLAQGKTWHEIMAMPVKPSSTPPPVETVASPSVSSDHSDSTEFSTFPPTRTEALLEAKIGPQPAEWGGGDEWDWQWDFLEWKAVQTRSSETKYEKERAELVLSIRTQREDAECEKKYEDEWIEISALKYSDQNQYQRRKTQRARRLKGLHLRLNGCTQEQIDAIHQEDAAHELQGFARFVTLTNPYENEPPRSGPRWPMSKEDIDAKRHGWDVKGLSREEQESGGGAHAATTETAEAQQPRASPRPPKDISRKTRGGRIAKKATQSQNFTRRGSPSRQPAPTSSKAPAPGRGRTQPRRAPGVPDEPGVGTARAQQQHHGLRRSGRLAGILPEFGMLSGRGEAPPRYEASQQPSGDTHTSRSGPRSRQLSKKPAAVTGGKPRGVSKAKPDGAGRSKRSAKQARA